MTGTKGQDQAKQLREKMEVYQENKNAEQTIHSMPSRSRVHKKRTKSKNRKFKLSFPLIRLLLVLFLALTVAAITYPYWNR
ncbi:hypothetical protein [Alkalihalobacillus deserti]|uniref:hypothetical protein n=1 Tax=Alkalihalobacillus deserti TaxID=2879466 RepID=UPI001D13AF1E|nr:hypothetical protein [Alkalihalobacillus deserti]